MERTRAKVPVGEAIDEFHNSHPGLSPEQLADISRFQWGFLKQVMKNPEYPVLWVEGWGKFEIRLKQQESQLKKINNRLKDPVYMLKDVEYVLNRKKILERGIEMAKEHYRLKSEHRKLIKPYMDLVKIWRKRDEILEGWLYKTFPKIENEAAREFRSKVAEARLGICRSNKCGFYDPKGESEAAVLKGQESCGSCGCPLSAKSMALSSQCALADLGKEPMWPAMLTEEQEEEMKKKLGENE